MNDYYSQQQACSSQIASSRLGESREVPESRTASDYLSAITDRVRGLVGMTSEIANRIGGTEPLTGSAPKSDSQRPDVITSLAEIESVVMEIERNVMRSMRNL